MKKAFKIFILLIAIVCSIMFSGCDIELIRKASSTEETTSAPLALPSGDENTTSAQQETKATAQSSQRDDDKEGVILSSDGKTAKAWGVPFNIENKTAYISVSGEVFSRPSADSTSKILKKGTQVVSCGVSENKNFNMIQCDNDSEYYFIYSSNISYEKVDPDPTQPTTQAPKATQPSQQTTPQKPKETQPPQQTTPQKPKTTTPQEPKETQAPKQTTPQTPKETQPAQKQDPPQKETIVVHHTVPPETKPQEATGGIPYPSKPSKTSINYGVTFADVNMNVKTVRSADLNSGPAKTLNSNGYKKIASYKAGTILRATGIGKNGWIRIKLSNGTVGFMNGIALVKA